MAAAPESYFSPSNPLYPVWPSVSQIDGVWFLALIYAMLLLPKLIAATLLASTGMARRYGGALHFAATTAVEIVLAIAYAPILMVQQTGAVLRALSGRGASWAPQRRGRVAYGWGELLRFHSVETFIGWALLIAMAAGALSLWLAPVALSLAAAPVLSWLSALPVSELRVAPLRLDSPVSLRAPRVARRAQVERAALAQMLAREVTDPIAAE